MMMSTYRREFVNIYLQIHVQVFDYAAGTEIHITIVIIAFWIKFQNFSKFQFK